MTRSSHGRAAATAAALLALAGPAVAHAQASVTAGYHDHAQLARALDSLQRAHPRLVTLSSLGTSAGGRALQAVRLGAGAELDARPALLVVANAYGPHVVGSEIALAAAGRMAAAYGRDSATTRLLDRSTVYFIPRANPDAAEALFQAPLAERAWNATKTDDDHDGVADEDGPNDVNGDGLITMMRVADPAGEWMTDPIDPFLMRRAVATKGERGGWSLYIEGVDDDHDGAFNEDAAGGADVNRNFSYDYQWFAPGAGIHQISERESRAVADFVIAHPNVAAVYVLGPQDNLLKPWEYRRTTGIAGNPPGTSQGGPLQSILQPDQAWFAEVGKRYKSATGQSKGPSSAPGEGDVLSWMYYDMGRMAFGSYGWVMPEATADTSKKGPKPEQPDPLADERQALHWLRTNAPNAIVAWTRVNHPDFPGRVVEVGGFRPYALTNPPASQLDSVLARQTAFIGELAGMLPSVSLREVKVEALGDRLFRVTAQVANDGYLPTMSAMGQRADWPRPVRVELTLGRDQQLAAGRAVQLLPPISGSGRSRELTWLVNAPANSSVTLKAASPMAGQASQTITLRTR